MSTDHHAPADTAATTRACRTGRRSCITTTSGTGTAESDVRQRSRPGRRRGTGSDA